MKKGCKKNRYLPWIATALLLLALTHPFLHELHDLQHTDFVSPYTHFESLHPEDIPGVTENKFWGDSLSPSGLAAIMISDAKQFFQESHPFSPNFSPDQQNLTLRC